MRVAQQLRPLLQDVGERVDHDAGVARLGGKCPRHDLVLGDLDQRGRALRDCLRDLGRVTGRRRTAGSRRTSPRAGRRTA